LLQPPTPSMRVIRMIVMEIKWVYIILRWFVVGLSAMGLRSMRLGFAKTEYMVRTFVKAVQPTPTMNTRSLPAAIVRGCDRRALS
jgi:hypothetical protein